MPDSYFAFFFFSAKKSNTVAPMPMIERTIAPDIKIDLLKIFILLSLQLILKIIISLTENKMNSRKNLGLLYYKSAIGIRLKLDSPFQSLSLNALALKSINGYL